MMINTDSYNAPTLSTPRITPDEAQDAEANTTAAQDEAEAGRDLDKLIAEKVFGIKRVFRPCDVKDRDGLGYGEDYHYIPSGKPPRTHMIDARPVPPFSTNIAAAWLVVEKMFERWNEDDRPAEHYWQFVDCYPSGWRADVMTPNFAQPDTVFLFETSLFLPTAICKAALKCIAATGDSK
jgi:Phage ABA sandwich domain